MMKHAAGEGEYAAEHTVRPAVLNFFGIEETPKC
jgi:hypothetical protein